MLVFDLSVLCKKLGLENGAINSFGKNGKETCVSLFCLSDFSGGVSFMALGLKLKSQGLSSRKIHKYLQAQGYKIGYANLFYLLKNN